MPIRYAEVTVILEETIARSIWLLTGMECTISAHDTIIVTFDDDDTPYHTKRECEQQETTLSFADTYHNGFPIYFYKHGATTCISKLATNDILYTNMLGQNLKVNASALLPSKYNIVFYSALQDRFGVFRLKSNETKPRFIAAYDDKTLDRQDVLYLVHNLLSKTWG